MLTRCAAFIVCGTVSCLGGWSSFNLASAADEPASHSSVPPDKEKLLRTLVARLRADAYEEREAAQAELFALSVENVPALRRLLAAETDQEARTRLSWVISRISRPLWKSDLAAAQKTARDADRPLLIFSTIGEVNGFS